MTDSDYAEEAARLYDEVTARMRSLQVIIEAEQRRITAGIAALHGLAMLGISEHTNSGSDCE